MIPRKQARSQGLKHYSTEKPCKYGHVSKRLTSTGNCVECIRLKHYERYPKERQSHLAYVKDWQKENKDKVNKSSQKWRATNKDKAQQTTKNYRERNKEKIKIKNQLWYQNNKAKKNHYTAMRRTIKLHATVKWANFEKIKEIYKEARRLTEITGTKHHVDHIIPLVNDLVCGLHVENNLQILTAKDNYNKNNKIEMPV